MIIDIDILDYLANPFIIADSAGKILKMNEPAESLIRLAGQPLPSFISDISKGGPPFQAPADKKVTALKVKIGNTFCRTHIFPLEMGGMEKGWLCLFEMPDVLRKMDFDTLLDYIDESIIILNHKGVIEHVNKMTHELTGMYPQKGNNMKEAVRLGEIKESLTLRTLKSKKPEKMNVQFKTGKILTFTSFPFFNKDGEIEKIINTGRDVTKLIQLQEDLRKTEILRDSYFNRLSELESLVGSNQIVHSSDQMRKVVSLAVKAAKSDSPVFIWGESGVGKELIADLIHRSSARNKKPYVGINCSAIPSDLLEAEFFGYEEGAFTGAKKGGKKGFFEEVKGGSIFLDEITEMPFPMQSKLLRVLQEREFMHIGGTKVVPLQARIISASNLNQKQLADPTKLRRDLFYRLNVIPIFIPPLRERREDILPLLRFFLKNMNLKYNTNIKISLSLMARLQAYHWPGNVRELKNVVEQLVVMADKDVVDFQDYLSLSGFEEKDTTLMNGDISVSGVLPLKTAFEKLEEILIKRAFGESGTIAKTARVLEINPCTIYRKIKKGSIRFE